MRIAATVIAAAVVLGIVGCGGSSSTSSIDASKSLAEQLRPVASAMKHDPTTLAYEEALREMNGARGLPDLRHHVEALLPKMTAYVRYVRSLRFPACARGVQHRLTSLLAESEAMTRASIPVLDTGDRDLAFAYLEKAHEATKEEAAALQRLYRAIDHQAGEGDGDTC